MQDPEGNKLQQRIKRMMKQKKMSKENQSITQLQKRKRAVSQTVLQPQKNSLLRQQNMQEEMSIRTEWRKRGNGSEKYRQTQNSESTTNQTGDLQSNRIQIQKIVQTVFIYSPKLTQYCQQQNLNKQNTMRQLLTNQLFVLSLSNKLSRLSASENQFNTKQSVGSTNSAFTGIVQSQVILKLSKLNRKRIQSLSCFDVQNRIKSLINKRLDMLGKY